MAFKIKFDSNNMPISPTFLLTKRNGDVLGLITNVTSININGSIDIPTISFRVFKDDNGIQCNVWDELTDFKIIYCIEWDAWFEITVSLSDSTMITKEISAVHLPQSELSQIILHDIEINTEDDIAREDYTAPTVLYNPNNPSISLLNRLISDKAPHYSIYHVDNSLKNIQRTFSFDSTSIKDAFDEIAEEINCVFVYGESLSTERVPKRTISVYDLSSVCNECGYRGGIFDTCPQCQSTNVTHGYGNDTTIFVNKDNFADEVIYSVDTEAVKNCFRLEAGDDLMTATIANCNPNGSLYLWYISEDLKNDMPNNLVSKIEEYNTLYETYNLTEQFTLNASNVTNYNTLINKYDPSSYAEKHIASPIVGFSNLSKTLYDVIDFQLYLNESMLPTYIVSDTTAIVQAGLLTQANLSPIAVSNYSSISKPTVENYVKEIAKIVIDSRYDVEINNSSYSNHLWTGNFIVTNKSDDTDTATSASVTITIEDNYKHYVQQKINKVISKNENGDYSLSSILSKNATESGGIYTGELINELRKYCLTSLRYILNACQSVIDILVEEGLGDDILWSTSQQNLYDQIYSVYYTRLKAIEYEISVRESDIKIVDSIYKEINGIKENVQQTLDFQNYLGSTLWEVLCSYRREDTYNNSNFISDGLSNNELFENAKEFLENAKEEIIKSATSQHKISSTFKNLLCIREFSKLVNYFDLWNWIRVEADGEIFKLRLIGYSINFDDLNNFDVEFSDIIRGGTIVSDSQSIVNNISSIASSYNAVSKQSESGAKAQSEVNNWKNNGISTSVTPIANGGENTLSFDRHGLLMRSYDELEDYYSQTQLRIINSSLAITDDNWRTTKAAIGLFKYKDPDTGTMKTAYGVNGETIIGNIIIGSSLGIYNANSSLKFNEDGLIVTNGTNTVTIDPDSTSVFTISKSGGNVISFDSNGDATFNGEINSYSGEIGGWTIDQERIYSTQTFDEVGGDNKTSTIALSNNFYTITEQEPHNPVIYCRYDGDYVFFVRSNGQLYASDADIKGKITATSGDIGIATNKIHIGTDTTNASIYSGTKSTLTNTSNGFYIGIDGISVGSNFSVNSFGELTATSVDLSGKITATSGVIGKASNSANKINIGTDTSNASIYSGSKSTLANTGNGFYLGADGMSIGSGFSVTNTGVLTINNATIGNWKLEDPFTSSHSGYSLSCLYTNSTTNNKYCLYLKTPTTDNDWVFQSSVMRSGQSTWSTFVHITASGQLYADGGVYSYDAEDGYSTGILCNSGRTGIFIKHGSASVYPRLVDIADTTGAIYLGGTYHPFNCLFAQNAQIQSSDRNLKKNIEPFSENHEKAFMEMQPITYMWNMEGHDRTHFGFIAQDTEKAFNDNNISTNNLGMVCYKTSDDGDTRYSLRYGEMVALNTHMIQKAIREIEELKSILNNREGN